MNFFADIFIALYIFTGFANAKGVNPSQVNFFLHTRINPARKITKTNIQLVIPEKSVVIIIHGYTDYVSLPWVQDAINILLRKNNYNVIAVDWSVPAFNIEYTRSARNTRDVGRLTGDLIVELHKHRNITLSKFHIIGHSLGAHVAGFAGKRVKELTKSRIKWITGLDAAAPYFEVPKQPKQNRLNEQDAEIVECLHTNGGVFGFRERLGTLDFFANGEGPLQPNCTPIRIPSTLKELQQDASCSHQKSTRIYNYALSIGGINAVKCDSYSSFKSGKCQGNYEVKLGNSDTFDLNQQGSYYFDIVI